MTVSKETVNTVVATILRSKGKEYTAEELKIILGLSLPSIRQAVSTGIMLGSLIKVPGSYPAKYRALSDIPQAGQTLIIREPAPAMEINKETMNGIRQLIQKEEFDETKISDQVAKFYKTAPPDKRSFLKDFLINFAEVIKADLEASKQLDPSDIKIGKK